MGFDQVIEQLNTLTTQFNDGVQFVADNAGNIGTFFDGVATGSTGIFSGSSEASDVVSNSASTSSNVLKTFTNIVGGKSK